MSDCPISARELYVTPATRVERNAAWLGALDGLRGRGPLPRLVNPVLLLLDLQNLFLDPRSAAFLPAWTATRESCVILLDAFRSRGLSVIRTRHISQGSTDPLFGRTMDKSDPLSQLHADLAPDNGETVLQKNHYSAWSVPELESLIPHGAPVVIAGVVTHRCVLATAIGAMERGRTCIVAADACAAPNEILQKSALAVLAAGFSHVAGSSEILAALDEGGKR